MDRMMHLGLGMNSIEAYSNMNIEDGEDHHEFARIRVHIQVLYTEACLSREARPYLYCRLCEHWRL